MIFAAAILNVVLAVLLVLLELAKMTKMFGEVCQKKRKSKDDIKESEMSRATENKAIETTDNEITDNENTFESTENETTENTTNKTTENTTIETSENNTIETTETSCSSGYDTDEGSIQFDIIKTPPGVKPRVIAFRRGLVKKNSMIFEHYCG